MTNQPAETMEDDFTFVEPAKEADYRGPMVDVFIPRLEEAGGGMKVDQYEHVTIANEVKEKCYKVLRGERKALIYSGRDVWQGFGDIDL